MMSAVVRHVSGLRALESDITVELLDGAREAPLPGPWLLRGTEAEADRLVARSSRHNP
jgi:hypothetical protein